MTKRKLDELKKAVQPVDTNSNEEKLLNLYKSYNQQKDHAMPILKQGIEELLNLQGRKHVNK
jgi:hypothetical protein